MGNAERNLETGNLETARLLEPYERPLIKNAWYCAAWADEVTDNLLARRIVNLPALLYRTQAGKAVALLDICPHKLAPLSQGARVGDNVQCGYHGLEFDCSGKCVKNPQGDGKVPNAAVRTFPLVERHGVLWIWPGQPERADESKIPDCSYLTDPKRRNVKGAHHVNANYMLLVENLLDLGHTLFLHRKTAGMPEKIELSEARIEQEGNSISDLRLFRDIQPPGLFARSRLGKEKLVDLSNDIHWSAPSVLITNNGISLPGGGGARAGERAVGTRGVHLLTPETQHTMHYFYGLARNYSLDDTEMDVLMYWWQRNALKAEDSRVAEAIDASLAHAMELGVRMVTLSTDVSALRVNRILDRMAAAEA